MSERARQADRSRRTRGDGEGAARAAKARRNAWLLGAVAVFFYVGYMAWMFIRALERRLRR